MRMELLSSASPTPSRNIIELRQALGQRFPHLRWGVPARIPPTPVATGIATLDTFLGGGLPRGHCTEIVANGPGSGSAEVIHQLLHHLARQRQYLALVDGLGSFDPSGADPAVLGRLLWV